jgi:SOS-response transcriptional repressor LexA
VEFFVLNMTVAAALSLRMETLRDQQIAWLKYIERTSGKNFTEIARASGIDPSTFSKFLANRHGHTLTAKTVKRIEDATRVPAYESNVLPKIVAFSEEEAQPYVLDQRSDNLLELSLRELVSRTNSIDLWMLKTDALSAIGYVPGMVVAVDREETPRNGDAVVAQRYDMRRGTAETIWRVWRTPYLLGAPSSGEPPLPEIVDNERVVIMGVLQGGVLIRH